MDNEVRSPLQNVQARVDRRKRLVTLARAALGDAMAIPLVGRMLYWMSDDELAVSLEEVGLLRAGSGKFVTIEQIGKEMLDVLRNNMGGSKE